MRVGLDANDHVGGGMKRLILSALLVAGLVAPALAQTPGPPTRVRGTIVSVTPAALTVSGITGATTVIALSPAVRITYFVKANLDKIPAGSFIGAAAEPRQDGSLTAIAVQIFAPGSKQNPGFGPWDLTPTSTMTNGTVDTIAPTKIDTADASVLSVSYEGGAKNVVITPKTVIVSIVPADATALVPGAHVLVFATKAADGSLSARAVGVGKDGLIPPL